MKFKNFRTESVKNNNDLYFEVCTHIVHHTKKKLVYYSGNYDSFVKTREEKEEEREKRYKAEQDQIKHMKDYVAKFGQGNAKMARQAQSKEKTLEKMLRVTICALILTIYKCYQIIFCVIAKVNFSFISLLIYATSLCIWVFYMLSFFIKCMKVYSCI